MLKGLIIIIVISNLKGESLYMRESIVQIKDLEKKIGDKLIIKGINLNIYTGEVFGFLGPNGAGKTTTIRMMLGLISITKGKILIQGHDIEKDFENAMLYVGGIVENPDMYKQLSGYKNLIHYARMHGKIDVNRINQVVNLVGLEKRIHNKVKTYSLGMRQRLGIAQALLHSPSLLVLDEPTNGLDPAGIYEMRELILNLSRKENITIFISSHLLSEMEQMCDRIGIIKNGELIEIKDISKTEDTNIKSIIDLVAVPEDKAKSIIENLNYECHTDKDDSKFQVLIKFEEIPKLIETLVKKNIKVYSISKSKNNLENEYLRVTGEE